MGPPLKCLDQCQTPGEDCALVSREVLGIHCCWFLLQVQARYLQKHSPVMWFLLYGYAIAYSRKPQEICSLSMLLILHRKELGALRHN